MDSEAGQPRLLYPLAELSLLLLQTGESKPLTPVPVRQPVLVRDLAFSRPASIFSLLHSWSRSLKDHSLKLHQDLRAIQLVKFLKSAGFVFFTF